MFEEAGASTLKTRFGGDGSNVGAHLCRSGREGAVKRGDKSRGAKKHG